jgi:hypothetical protein
VRLRFGNRHPVAGRGHSTTINVVGRGCYCPRAVGILSKDPKYYA